MMPEPIRIIYVDDEPALLEIGKRFLEMTGEFAVTTAESAGDAIQILAEQPFDAFISDYQMPGMDGIAFLKHLRAAGNSTPFIIFTGRGREEVAIQALNEGADFYLQKGGDPKSQFVELSNTVRYAVSRRQSEERLKESEKRLYDIIQFLPDATFAIDSSGVVIAWNHAIEEMTGVKQADMVGKSNYEYSIPFYGERRPILIDLVSISDEELPHSKYTAITRDGDVLTAETSLARPLGKYAVLFGKASPLYNEDGEVFGAIESIRDITDRKEAEEAIRESEERYRNVVETQSEFICRFLPDGTHIFVNEAYCRRFDKNPEELIGTRFKPVIHPDDREKVSRLFASLTPDHPVDIIEQRIVLPDNEVVWDRWSTRAFFNDDCTIREYQSIGRDITELKERERLLQEKNEELAAAEEELRSQLEDITATQRMLVDSEERYRAIFEHTEAPTVIIEEDTSISLANRAFAEISGYSQVEVIGRSWTEFVSEQDLTRMIAIHRQRREEGGDPPTEYEFTFINRYGETRAIHLTAGIIPGTRQSVASFHDLTEQKKAEMALREREETYRRIVDTSAEGIWQMDDHFRITYVNKRMADMLGYAPEEMIGMNATSLIPPDELADSKLRRDRQRRGEVDHFERRFIRKDGGSLWTHIAITPIIDAEEHYQGSFSMLTDITERKAAEESLHTTNKKLQLLSRITRHDIVNQILALRAYLDLTLHEIDDPTLSGYLTGAEKAVAAIEKQIEFTRLYEEIGVHTPAWQSLSKLIEKIDDSRLPIQHDCSGISVYADPMIEKVLWNLYENTIRHAEGATGVWARCEEEDDGPGKQDGSLVITWEDDATGIPADEKERIFERGFGKNNGFGLFLAREILAITGITIRETGEPGKGARFEMVVPNRMWRNARQSE